MKQLTGLDASFLYLETPEMPMHVGALNVYELPAGHRGRFITLLRHHMAERMPLMPVLRRRLWWMPLNLANPAWVDAEPDLKLHIVEHRLPDSAKQGDGLPELEAIVGTLHGHRLDRSKPLWKMHVLEGLAPSANGRKRVGLYSQFHHAAVDGQAAVALARVLLDVSPEGRALDIKPSSRPRLLSLSLSQMLRGALANEAQQVAAIVKDLPATLSTLGGAAGSALRRSGLLGPGKGASAVSNLTLAPRTVFNQSITAGRAFAALSLPLADLKALGRAHGATLNDIILLLCATALRRYFQQHKALPRKSLIAAVPISLREKGDTTADNQASMSLISLGTHLADLGQRLQHIKAASAAMKAAMGSVKSILPTDFPSIGVPWLMEAVTALYGRAKVADKLPQVANVVISNVPGPPVALYLAGAHMQSNFPTSIVVHGMALNITVESYDRQMDFGLVADSAAMPDVQALARAIALAFDDLQLLEVHAAPAAPGLVVVGDSLIGQARKRLTVGLTEGVKQARRSAEGAARRTARAAVDAVVEGAVGAASAVAGATTRSRASAPSKRKPSR